MGLIIIVMCALVLAAVTVVLGVAFGYHKNATLKNVFAAAMFVALMIGVFSFVLNRNFNSEVVALKDTYNNLTIYQPLVEETENEYIRYNFFIDVNEYNKQYEKVKAIANNKWYGALVPKHWNTDVELIEFKLNGIVYKGGH